MISNRIHRSSFIQVLVVVMTFSGLSVSCSSIPKDEILKDARDAYIQAKANPNTANVEAMYDAEQSLKKAEQAEEVEEMEHLAYLAQRQAQRAMAVAERKQAEEQRESLVKEKNHLLLEAREREIAEKAQDAEMALKQKEKAHLLLEAREQEISAKAQEVEMAHQELVAKQAEIQKLEDQIAKLQGRETERGLVVTLDDVLFETGKADLLSGARRNIETVAAFLHQNDTRNDTRNVLVEGHTDNRGTQKYNLGLSQRRADTVRFALIRQGITSNRILARGFGESQPIASNSTASGRQQNRRVEITILNEGEILR